MLRSGGYDAVLGAKFSLVIPVVASGAVLVSLSVSAELRKRDYSLLRTLGMTRLRMASLLVWGGFAGIVPAIGVYSQELSTQLSSENI